VRSRSCGGPQCMAKSRRWLAAPAARRKGGLEATGGNNVRPAAVTDSHMDPARWYSVDRARLMPTTLIIKARKPFSMDRAAQQRDGVVGRSSLDKVDTSA